MPLEHVHMPARKMVLFFIVDTSYSMEGSKIAGVNDAIEEIIPMLSEISENNNDAEIEVAVLQFSSGAKWLYDQTIPAVGFSWRHLDVSGMTDFGEACKELTAKLTTQPGGFMQSATGSYAPVFILLSDGEPTDTYEYHLNALKEKKWFKAGVKIAIAIGEDANENMLAEFTGTKEAVYTVHNVEGLKKIIRCVSITSSLIASQSSTVGDGESKQEEIIRKIDDELKDDFAAGTITPADDLSVTPIDDDWD